MKHRPVATVGRPTAGGEPLGPAVASFLAERDLAPSSHRVYVLALDRLVTCHASSQAGLLCAICVVWIYNDPAPLPG